MRYVWLQCRDLCAICTVQVLPYNRTVARSTDITFGYLAWYSVYSTVPSGAICCVSETGHFQLILRSQTLLLMTANFCASVDSHYLAQLTISSRSEDQLWDYIWRISHFTSHFSTVPQYDTPKIQHMAPDGIIWLRYRPNRSYWHHYTWPLLHTRLTFHESMQLLWHFVRETCIIEVNDTIEKCSSEP